MPSNNTLEKIINGDLRADLSSIADNQPWVKQAPINILITGNYQKMIDKYTDKGDANCMTCPTRKPSVTGLPLANVKVDAVASASTLVKSELLLLTAAVQVPRDAA